VKCTRFIKIGYVFIFGYSFLFLKNIITKLLRRVFNIDYTFENKYFNQVILILIFFVSTYLVMFFYKKKFFKTKTEYFKYSVLVLLSMPLFFELSYIFSYMINSSACYYSYTIEDNPTVIIETIFRVLSIVFSIYVFLKIKKDFIRENYIILSIGILLMFLVFMVLPILI